MGNKQDLLLEQLKKYYEQEPFSLGLHTTSQESAKAICKTGLKTGVRALEGTIKFRGDLQDVCGNDLVYFFPDTECTVVVAIPKKFDAPRITDNLGGYQPLCEFSQFFEKAQEALPNYQDNIQGVLPSYYVLGYYNKDFEFVVNEKCLLIDQEGKKQFENDCFDVDSYHALF